MVKVSETMDELDRNDRPPQTACAVVTDSVTTTNAFSVDDLCGASLTRRENRRQALLQSNAELAAPYVDRAVPDAEFDQIERHREQSIVNAFHWLDAMFEKDVPVRLILVAAARSEINFGSNKELAAACGLSVGQVRAAKDRLRYKISQIPAQSFEAFLEAVGSNR